MTYLAALRAGDVAGRQWPLTARGQPVADDVVALHAYVEHLTSNALQVESRAADDSLVAQVVYQILGREDKSTSKLLAKAMETCLATHGRLADTAAAQRNMTPASYRHFMASHANKGRPSFSLPEAEVLVIMRLTGTAINHFSPRLAHWEAHGLPPAPGGQQALTTHEGEWLNWDAVLLLSDGEELPNRFRTLRGGGPWTPRKGLRTLSAEELTRRIHSATAALQSEAAEEASARAARHAKAGRADKRHGGAPARATRGGRTTMHGSPHPATENVEHRGGGTAGAGDQANSKHGRCRACSRRRRDSLGAADRGGSGGTGGAHRECTGRRQRTVGASECAGSGT